ncbi:hypothetical protein [Dubosiella newyorkensis]|uniref:hypothetical protein n=1 Tax=Dubosiella newyorkensis TaxID=1862672 RepID=UPI00259C9F3D|nr:hypothetical protein [Dubosiella newyorkensis]
MYIKKGGEVMSLNYGKDYTGLKFGHLTVTSFFPTEETKGSWNCKCDCGNDNIVVYTNDLSNKRITSCNCTLKEYPYEHRTEKVSKYTFIYNDIVHKPEHNDYELYKKATEKYQNI